MKDDKHDKHNVVVVEHRHSKPASTSFRCSSKGDNDAANLKRKISFLNGVPIIVGIIIGSGVFASLKGILGYAGCVGLLFIIWVKHGLVSKSGAYCYADLGNSIMKSAVDCAYEADGTFLACLRLWIECTLTLNCSKLAISYFALKTMFPDCEQHEFDVGLLAITCICSLLALKTTFDTKVCTNIQRYMISQCNKLMNSNLILDLPLVALQQISGDTTVIKSYARYSADICTSTPIMVPPIPVPYLTGNVTVEDDVIQENRRLTELILCIHCMTRNREVIYIPCGHFLYCTICDNLKYHRNCPLCHARIRGSVRKGTIVSVCHWETASL